MAVFRVEKTKDFTVMSNHHLRNAKLSLSRKARSRRQGVPRYRMPGCRKMRKAGWILRCLVP